MSLGCAQCGDCCDPVEINAEVIDHWQAWLDYWRVGGTDDPKEENGEPFSYDPTLRFIAAHMTEVSRAPNDAGTAIMVAFQCAFFNTTTRLCEAYELRPPMCSNYPWYEDGATPHRISRLEPRCSYALDVPPPQRRPDARPLIPLTVVKR